MTPPPPPPPSAGSWDAPPAPGGYGAPTPKPSIGIRFGARFIDGLLVGVPLAIVLVNQGIFLAGLVSAVAHLAYNAILESNNNGQTVGKMLLKLRVVSADGNAETIEQAAKRNIWLAAGIVPFLGGLVQLVAAILIATTSSSDPAGEGWHDKLAGARVVHA